MAWEGGRARQPGQPSSCAQAQGLCSSPAFPPHPSGEESSSDETSNTSSPTLRRRRAKKRLVSSSEVEDVPPQEQEPEAGLELPHKHQFSSGLNRCIILALVIAVSMGLGHFYGECYWGPGGGAVHPGRILGRILWVPVTVRRKKPGSCPEQSTRGCLVA